MAHGKRGQDRPAIGAVVCSRAGRDSGRRFVVVGWADENHVLLVDGDTRKLDRPKRKKIKHLRAEPATMESAEALLGGNCLQDAAIRRALKALDIGENGVSDRTEGGKTCQNRT